MKTLVTALSLSFVVSALAHSASAASYKTSFQIPNVGVRCDDAHMSRFEGREVSLAVEDTADVLALAKTDDGSQIVTEIRGLNAVESGQECKSLRPSPKVLTGVRELYVSAMKSDDKCNAYIVDAVTLKLGRGNPVLFGKTAYPVIGDDFSVWSKEICLLTEKDFEAAIAQVISRRK
jgi:hypothetical protein